MDNQTRLAIWSMSDEDSDVLVSITRKHLKLVLELIDAKTLHERRNILRVEIQALNAQRNALIESYRQNEKGRD